MNFEFDNNIPIYVQLVEQLKMNIISGKYELGERLPSVREFAMLMRVNPNTMQKALVELENLDLIYTERTNGKYVTTNKKLVNKLRSEYAKEMTKKYFMNMQGIGFNIEEVYKYMEEYGDDK